jgi:hypothetical protein
MRTFPGRSTINFLSLMAGACVVLATPFPASGQKVRIENGVEVIYNPKDPVPRKGVPSTPVLKEDLVIGAESGDDKYMFSSLRTIRIDNDGNIYALDNKDINIKVFDKNGVHLRTMGKRGQGPGEIQMPSAMSVSYAGHQIGILDIAANKFVVFTNTWECIKETPLGTYSLISALMDDTGRIYGNSLVFSDNAVTTTLAKYDSGMKREATIAEISEKIIGPKINALPTRIAFGLMSGDRLAWAFTEKYEISIVDSDSKTVRKIVKDCNRLRVTEKDKEDMIKMEWGDSPPDLVFPDSFPSFRSLIADEKGFIYVRTYEKDDRDRYRYDVFDADGLYIARFFLPSSERLAEARSGKLYCLIEENEAGIPQIKRYSLEWK